MNNELISIVVPVYKVEQYVAKCLDSIIAQTYTNIEILVVDDGTPDNSGVICDEYAAKDSRIKVFHFPNGGVAKARQIGVEKSIGEYIVFVDPDDWLPSDSVEILYSNMSDDVDLVIGGYEKLYTKRSIIFKLKPSILASDEYIKQLLLNKLYKAPWGRMFRRSCITSECFPSLKKGQDFLMNIEIGLRMRCVKTLSNNIYRYVLKSESTTHSIKPTLNQKKQFYEHVEFIIKSHGLYKQYEKELFYFALNDIYYLFARGGVCDSNDIWIMSIVDKSNHINCSIKQRVVIMALKYAILQSIIYNTRNIAAILKRLIYS